MAESESKIVASIKGEEASYCDDALYNITSFGADLTFRELVSMYQDGDLEKPELQRKYVWNRLEASRFIDSVLLGLPVPSIFLAKTEDNKRLIVDGYQRIMTVYDYISGIFSGDGKVFKLSTSEMIHSEWRGKAFAELSEEHKRAIRLYSIHAIVFEQKHPQDDTGMYQIFERINTSGRTLKPQEIRNCVYHGSFNQLLFEINKLPLWRKIIGSENEDGRMADIELILRFFAFSDFKESAAAQQKQINLVKYLNEYMGKNACIDQEQATKLKSTFTTTMQYLVEGIGEHLFRTAKEKNGVLTWSSKVNPVIFDAVCVATVIVNMPNKTGIDLQQRYEQLLLNPEFQSVTRQRTTNTENINRRIYLAAKILYGVEI